MRRTIAAAALLLLTAACTGGGTVKSQVVRMAAGLVLQAAVAAEAPAQKVAEKAEPKKAPCSRAKVAKPASKPVRGTVRPGATVAHCPIAVRATDRSV